MDDTSDFKRGLKSLWAEMAQGNKPSLEASRRALASLPLNRDPLSEVLAHLVFKKTKQIEQPLVPRFVAMPVAELCQLAILWDYLGENEAASLLAHSIPCDFPWLWSRENEYFEEETKTSLAMLAKAQGRSGEEILSRDPYLQALANRCPRFDAPCHFGHFKPVLHWSLHEIGSLKCCSTLIGDRTSIGAIRADGAEIRALGPQVFPLSDPLGFGIRSVGEHGNRWASPVGNPEIWFETKIRKEEARIVYDLTFFGLKPSAPLAFSFYVKAESAQIGPEKFKPKTLHRYQGIAKPILFGGSLMVESLSPGKMELIPLAGGGGGYWNCDYLASYEVHPVNAKMTFALYQTSK